MNLGKINNYKQDVSNAKLNLQTPFNGENVKRIKKTEDPKKIYPKNLKIKKLVCGMSSALIAGSGQIINGELNKGLTIAGATLTAWLGLRAFDTDIINSLINGTKIKKSSMFGVYASLAAIAGLKIFSVVESIKNTKTKSNLEM